jgi:hypothetical protein
MSPKEAGRIIFSDIMGQPFEISLGRRQNSYLIFFCFSLPNPLPKLFASQLLSSKEENS